jgi:hypothetical protein
MESDGKNPASVALGRITAARGSRATFNIEKPPICASF